MEKKSPEIRDRVEIWSAAVFTRLNDDLKRRHDYFEIELETYQRSWHNFTRGHRRQRSITLTTL